MILQKQITEWYDIAPWSNLDQVEHDFILSRALCELYSSPIIANELVFRGGTALHKLFFSSAGRFSEDLDFVQREAKPIGNVIDVVRQILDPWLGKPKWKQSEGRFTLYYRFTTEVEPVVSRKLKIEINTREHFHIFPHKKIAFNIDSSWYKASTEILTYQLEELLGTKLRALYQRKKGRDLFDFWFAFQQQPNIKVEDVVYAFNHYMEKNNTSVSRKVYRDNLEAKRLDPLFNKDIMSLLTLNDAQSYSLDEAYNILFDRIIPLLDE